MAGFYKAKLLWKHLLKCDADKVACDADGALFNAGRILATSNSEFNKCSSGNFHNNNAGLLCKTDPVITVMGNIMCERSVRKEGG